MLKAANKKQSDNKDERQRELLEWLIRQGKNLTTTQIAEMRNISTVTARKALTALQEKEQIFMFKIHNTTWWYVSRSEFKKYENYR